MRTIEIQNLSYSLKKSIYLSTLVIQIYFLLNNNNLIQFKSQLFSYTRFILVSNTTNTDVSILFIFFYIDRGDLQQSSSLRFVSILVNRRIHH